MLYSDSPPAKVGEFNIFLTPVTQRAAIIVILHTERYRCQNSAP
jgi:hypothetical protein